jgi:hypothetical protein
MIKEFEEFLERETPSYNGCMLCKFNKEDGTPKFHLITRKKAANRDMFLVDSNFAWDFEFEWKRYPNWEIIYKYVGNN